MKYVLDSNVALKWVLPEKDSAKAIALHRDSQAGIHDLIAPEVFPVEAAHALTRAERRGVVTVGAADVHLFNILQTGPQLHSYLPLLKRAVGISSAERVGVYDCLYVALAEREGCEFVTADDKLVKRLKPTFPFIVALSALP
jgi:predicted nucleic acid-binding protein